MWQSKMEGGGGFFKHVSTVIAFILHIMVLILDGTVCPRNSDPFYIVSYIERATTSSTNSL